jgi:ketosteroid isomerase-like protein
MISHTLRAFDKVRRSLLSISREGRIVTRTLLGIPGLVAALASAQTPSPASQRSPQALEEMVQAERAFAATARVKGIRDSFLEFFADDAMFEPGAGLAKDQLRKQEPQPFSVRELVWEPRTGDVAASGELGWLTGPGTFINHAAENKTPRHTNYLSIWRKEADGRWRVFIDLGTTLNAPATFAPGFTRFSTQSRFAGNTTKTDAEGGLRDADRKLNERIGSEGAARAYAAFLVPGARLHRAGAALTESSAIRGWLERHGEGMTAQTAVVESARSGDLGYSYGKYQLRGEKPATYLRIWTRNAEGEWRVAADVFVPPPNS